MPHSGIRGSKAVQRLTAAYRSRPRPSSTPGAKASTVCPSYLDGDQKTDASCAPAHRPIGRFARRALRPPSVVFPWLWLCGFQGPRRVAGRGLRPSRGLSKLSSAPAAHEARRQARSTFLGPGRIPGAAGFPTAIPRKEVIQPHLPVRLPCYDFTPVTGPTFDGSLPNGLGHRLRVLPTSVV